MDSLDLIKLALLMERTSGIPQVTIGLIDGPVVTRHPSLASEHLREISGHSGATCIRTTSAACLHGTFIAGILSAKRTSTTPGICPNCTLLVRPIFTETTSRNGHMPSATPLDLAAAMIACIDAGARVINLSLGLAHTSTEGERALGEALNYAAGHGVIVVAAAGNQGTVGSSALTRHPWVIPVVACDVRGRPMIQSNLGNSIGRRGVSAPGDGIASLGPENHSITLRGTSVAVPFVTGTVALMWSEYPAATATQIKLAIKHTTSLSRPSVVPPLLDAAASYRFLLTAMVTTRTA